MSASLFVDGGTYIPSISSRGDGSRTTKSVSSARSEAKCSCSPTFDDTNSYKTEVQCQLKFSFAIYSIASSIYAEKAWFADFQDSFPLAY
jgi:hypothetical protein